MYTLLYKIVTGSSLPREHKRQIGGTLHPMIIISALCFSVKIRPESKKCQSKTQQSLKYYKNSNIHFPLFFIKTTLTHLYIFYIYS